MNANQELLENLHNTFSIGATRYMVLNDFSKTFKRIGVSCPEELAYQVIEKIINARTIEEAEFEVEKLFLSDSYIKNKKNVFDFIQAGLEARTEILFREISPHLNGIRKVIDYGCGNGMLAQTLHDRCNISIKGVDIRDFLAEDVSIPFVKFDGHNVPVLDKFYECGILVHVLHHEKENEKILKELDRIVSKKLIIIETIPEANNEEEAEKDWGRMLWNDTLWNRFFNHADIPVPGTYEIPLNWIKRFEIYGWKNTVSEDLGFDISTIQDRHHLFVFER